MATAQAAPSMVEAMPTVEEQELARRQDEIARRTARAFRKGDDLEQALREVLDIVRETLSCTRASVQFKDAKGTMVSLVQSGEVSEGAASEISLPLVLNGKVVGLLKAEDLRTGQFDETDMRVLSQIQQQITTSATLAGYAR
jgi:GAF domain-containing protein